MLKKFLTFFIFLTGTVFFSFAQNVNENELKSADGTTIVFENYEGPHSVIDTISAIDAIGSSLGKRVTDAGKEKAGTFGGNEKYSVIHAVDPEEKGKLDADIIIINEDATVDHIRNLRRIIASYLSQVYGYSPSDASTVATFVTVYNAVYRNQIDSFSEKYKGAVIKNLSNEKCGLSVKWSDWAGKSQIVIPLGEYEEGGLSSVETSVISDKKVVESMREEDDRGIDERKNMVDIKEREAEAAEEEAQEAAKEEAEGKKALSEQKQVQNQAEKNAKEKQKEADEAQTKADEAKKEAEADPNNKQKKKEAEAAQKEADSKQKEADEANKQAASEKKKTEETQKKVDDSAKRAEESQQKADKKSDEAQSERKEIAKDQQEIIAEERKQAEDGTVIGLRIVKETDYLSSLVKVNAKNGKLVKESPVKVIRGRTIIEVNNPTIDGNVGGASQFFMAICGENTGKGAIKLCLLDALSLEIQKESEEKVSKASVLINGGENFYCVVENGSGWAIGQYDKSLNLIRKSDTLVTESTPITITKNGIIVTKSDGKPCLLSAVNLSVIE